MSARPALLALALLAATSVPAGAQTLTRDELQAMLKARDARIADLERRLAALEAREAPSASTPGPETVPPPSSPPSPARAQADPADGDDASLRAISRGLVARGAMVLPTGAFEIAPSAVYSHAQQQGLVLVDTPEGVSTVSDQRQRDDSIQAEIAARVGLPWRSQLELRVPFAWKSEASALGDGTLVRHDATHLGDIQLELSHQFLAEKGWRPDLVGALAWRFPTGLDPFDAPIAAVANGVGSHQFTARLTALKTLDPLVVFSTVSYTTSLGRHESVGFVRPGDAVGWDVGALLAVSPETSLSLGFSQQFTGRTHAAGVAIEGSDGVAAVAQFGIDQVISSRALVDITFGVGVTRDAPDYQVLVSVPIRFR